MSTKINKSLIALALVSLVSISLAYGPPCTSTANNGGYSLANRLNLTAEQLQQVQTVLQEQRQEARAWRKDHRAETETRLSKVLNAEQMEQFKALKQHRFNAKGRHFKPPF